MSRYIDADLLQEDFKEAHDGKRSLMIDVQPTADVRENVRGEWIACLEDNECFVCSVCGEGIYYTGIENYCPHCGADMRGEKC